MMCLAVTVIRNECKCIPGADLQKEGFNGKGYVSAYGCILDSVNFQRMLKW